jgi:hypothetical protein
VRWQAVRLGLAVRFGAPPLGLTLAEYFEKTGQGAEARRLLWDPLATAVVNETPERAAAVCSIASTRKLPRTARRPWLVFRAADSRPARRH